MTVWFVETSIIKRNYYESGNCHWFRLYTLRVLIGNAPFERTFEGRPIVSYINEISIIFRLFTLSWLILQRPFGVLREQLQSERESFHCTKRYENQGPEFRLKLNQQIQSASVLLLSFHNMFESVAYICALDCVLVYVLDSYFHLHAFLF